MGMVPEGSVGSLSLRDFCPVSCELLTENCWFGYDWAFRLSK